MQIKVSDILKFIKHCVHRANSFSIAVIACLIIGTFVLAQATHPTSAHAEAEQTLTSYAQTTQSWKDGNLIIDMTPALCRLDGHYRGFMQCKEVSRYSIHGLEFNHRCSSKTKPQLSPLQEKTLSRYMPDKAEQIRAWQEYASCNNITASRYFRQIIQQANQLQLPSLLTNGRSQVVSKGQVIQQLQKQNAGLTKQSVQLICQPSSSASSKGYPVLTQIKLCYKGGQFQTCDSTLPQSQSCNNTFAVLGS